ncbi:MAG: hypothetical protein A3K09_07495, partial [Nitrospinae bacterium RIFCSPLOWO2_12_FULL_47_7]
MLDLQPTILDETITRSCGYLFSIQDPEGFWAAELESNATITAEYIFFMHFMGIPDPVRQRKCAQYLLQHQQEDGGWNLFYGAPSNISATVEAYIALKMSGISPDRPEMSKARECIFSLGGIRATRVFTKIFLALLGQVSWDVLPVMPVEIILLPNWFYFNIYEMSSWSRGTVVPLTIIYAHQPVFKLDENQGVRELFRETDRNLSLDYSPDGLSWRNFFIFIDRSLKLFGKSSWKPFRNFALNRAKKWTLKHQEPEGDFGGIQPAMFNSLLALKCLGYSNDDPVIVKGLSAVDRFIIDKGDHLVLQACVSPLWDTSIACNALLDAGFPGDHPALVKAGEWMLKKQVKRPGDWKVKNPNTPPGGWAFEFFNEMYYSNDDPVIVKGLSAVDRFIIDKGDHLVLQACVSPLWDTSIACNALLDAGFPGDHPALVKAGEWMLKKQVKRPGDWKVKNPNTPPGGWAFEFFNEMYPDNDDTAEILMALHRIRFSDGDWKEKECRRALVWLLSMQSENGGWGAFDQDNDHSLFNEIPFADHGAMLDPPTVDVTGRILWLLGLLRFDREDPQVKKAIEFIKSEQEHDGCWFGRWGVNYIYGTFLVLNGLGSIGEDMTQECVTRAVDWILSRQNADGGWGETCDSYEKPHLR